MPSGMVTLSKVRRGCIYWVDFEPVRGSEQGKTRPALVIQNNLGNLTSHTTIVQPLLLSEPPHSRSSLGIAKRCKGWNKREIA